MLFLDSGSFGYAAYTQKDPKPFFEKAGPASKGFAKTCQFGHTFEEVSNSISSVH